MTPFTQTIIQGIILLIAAPCVPILVRAVRDLIARRPVGNLRGQVTSFARELMLRDGQMSGSWFTGIAPTLIFALSVLVACITPTIMTSGSLSALSDISIVTTMIVTALAVHSLAVIDQGGAQRMGHLALTFITLILISVAIGSDTLPSRIFAVMSLALVGAEMLRDTCIPYRGFSGATIRMSLAMFGLVLGFVAAHVTYQGFDPLTLSVKAAAILIAFVVIEEATDRLKLTRNDRLILALACAVVAFVIAFALHIQNLV